MSVELEDEPGSGHFQIEIEMAGERTYKRVPTLDTTKLFPSEYIKSQFEKGEIFVAFRQGGEGVCSIVVNPAKLDVERINTLFKVNPLASNLATGNRMMKQEITGKDAYKPIVINPFVVNGEVEKAEIKGKLKEGKLPFLAKIYFVPSY